MFEKVDPFQLFVAGAAIFGLLGVGFGTYQFYILLAGTDGVGPASDELGAVACEEPAMGNIDPSADAFAVETTTTDHTDEHFTLQSVGEGPPTTITLAFDRPAVFEAHAVRVDGSSPTVTVDDTTVTIEDDRGERIKLWVDAETADGDRIRHQMELCP